MNHHENPSTTADNAVTANPAPDRTLIARHFSEINGVSHEERVALVACFHGVPETEVIEIVTSRAVSEYLHALGISHEPALEVLIAAARKFHLPTEALQSAVDEHLLSVEAL